MDFLNSASKFGELSTQYREKIADSETEEAKQIMKEIKSLIYCSVNEINTIFNIKLDKRASLIQTKKGIPLYSLSINNIIAKKDNLKMRDITTLNPLGRKKQNGVILMLDYSGSMWFGNGDGQGDKSDTIDGVIRIHAQNFLALVMAQFMQQQQKAEITFNCFCDKNHHIFSKDVQSDDIDLLIVHKRWGSGIKNKTSLMPKQLQNESERFFSNEKVNDAINDAFSQFRHKHLSNFTFMMFTDGGLSMDLVESKENRKSRLEEMFSVLKSQKRKIIFTFIKEQHADTAKICRDNGFISLIFNDEKEYDSCFLHYSNILKQVGG